MATAKQLPSGSWRVRVYDSETGKYLSFTSKLKGKEGKKEAEYLANEWLMNRKKRFDQYKTLDDCLQEYIESKENILSPSTIRGYYIIKRTAVSNIKNVQLKKITEITLQKWVNENTQKYSAKSVRNQFGLICAALRQQKIHLDFNSILLPKKVPTNIIIPTEEQMSKILKIIEGTSIELPVTMALTLGLRQSEIAALKWEDYNGVTLKIHAAKVPDKDNKFVIKNTTKSEASTREIEVNSLLKLRLDRAKKESEFISPMLPSNVLSAFHKICEENELPKFTMHAQRHANASVMLEQGVPDKYAMERLGQSSPNMIKTVYQHLFDEKQKEISKTLNDKFSEIYDTKNDTK